MSLAITLKVPEGLVLATDSRVTYPVPNSSGDNDWATFDNATKLLEFKGHDYVGAVTFGAGSIGNRTAHSFLPEFLSEIGNNRLRTAAFSRKMSEFFMARWNEGMPATYSGLPMVFNIGGYDPGKPHAKVMSFQIPGQPTPTEILQDDFNILYGGDFTIVDRIINGADSGFINMVDGLITAPLKKQQFDMVKSSIVLPINISALSLQDGVNLALTLVRTTIEIQSLEMTARTVGGHIDIATITREGGLKFVQVKKIKGEKMNNDMKSEAKNSANQSLPKRDWRQAGKDSPYLNVRRDDPSRPLQRTPTKVTKSKTKRLK